MNAHLLNRESGICPPVQLQRLKHSELLHALQASIVKFDRYDSDSLASTADNEEHIAPSIAHQGGVNSITIDRFEGRYLLSGGADASVAIWDLEAEEQSADASSCILHKPLATVSKPDKQAHSHGITQLSFYPFDSLAFLSTSYDHTLKIWSSETLKASASFNLESVVYAHAVSPIAQHLLVACATQHPAVRLVDLRSGAAAHALPGHVGALLSVAWSPVNEHILASGGTDGTVKFWDVRRSAAYVATLDAEDSVGVVGYNLRGSGARPRTRGKAHAGPVNGLVWLPDGRHIVTAGHDEKIRVWNTTTGANTLTNFGPLVKNKNFSQILPCLVPPEILPTGRDAMFYPNEREILMHDVFEGQLLKRLRPTGTIAAGAGTGKLTQRQRVTDLAWRHLNVEMYSAHGNGTIQAWKPKVDEDLLLDEDERQERESEKIERDKKRKALEDIYQAFAKRVDFTNKP